MRMKYVIFNNDDFIIMPNSMSHSDATKIGTPVSAGFCSIGKNGFSCYGESISLNLKADKEDSFILNMSLE
ncbi:hypothetical protein [Clostridium sp.]|uniref:hypothetical protein n=1 Tax=Clostridium sp. TaxID=1506 RepID=UPI003216EAEC